MEDRRLYISDATLPGSEKYRVRKGTNVIIENLDYLDAVSEAIGIVGGEDVFTRTDTFATYGFGYANADAAASGQPALTSTDTWTSVSVSPYVAFTQAYASASAYTHTDNGSYFSDSESRSIYLST